jgi:hypothetical protein
MALTNYLTDFKETTRLILQIERDVLAQTHLSTLLISARATLAGHREELHAVQARITRTRSANGRRAKRQAQDVERTNGRRR